MGARSRSAARVSPRARAVAASTWYTTHAVAASLLGCPQGEGGSRGRVRGRGVQRDDRWGALGGWAS